MTQFALDPIACSEALQAAGMPKAQADVIAKTQQSTLDKMLEAKDLATKKDIALALKDLEMRLTDKISAPQFNLVKWMISMFVTFGAMIIAAMAWLLPR